MNKALLIALLLIGSIAVLPAAAPTAAADPGCTVDDDGQVDCSQLIEELEPWLYCPGPNPLCWNP